MSVMVLTWGSAPPNEVQELQVKVLASEFIRLSDTYLANLNLLATDSERVLGKLRKMAALDESRVGYDSPSGTVAPSGAT